MPMNAIASSKFYRNSSWHFALFRILFGLYLSIHFFDLIHFAPEIWSAAGNLGDPRILPSYRMFPNLLFWFTSPGFATVFIWCLFLISIAFTIGFYRRAGAFVLWYGWACLAGRNPFIANPGLPFIGLLLLACVIIPSGEPLAVTKGKDRESWQMPEGIFEGLWIIMALGYTISGLHKCMSPSWADGTAIIHLLNNPLSRDNLLRETLLSMPEFLLKLNTWGVLGLEVLFAPLCLFSVTRKWTWLAMIGMHLGIVSLVNFADLTIGVLMVHIFTFDERWLPGRKTENSPVLFFDGVCGLCNGFVQFLFDVDQASVFKVATLQGGFAAERLPETLTKNLNSLVVMTSDGELLTKSKAVLYVMRQTGGLWRIIGVGGLIFPAALTDFAYDAVAKNRYQLFGKLESCRMPTPSERSRFVG
jgi:predicted DCC family thiol-disulfide oxidoreductase YuxK